VSPEKAVPRDFNAPKVNNRKGRSSSKHKLAEVENGSFVNRLLKAYHGASSYLVYQEACKVATTTASRRVRDEGFIVFKAASEMYATLETNEGVLIADRHCRNLIKSAIANGYNGISPQKPGGQALPSSVEKSIALIVKGLRERHFPVFSEEVLSWAAIEIKGT
jgi:hypothetical protein